MSIRYLTNAVIALLGGLVVVASQAFTTATVAWLATGVAIAVLAVSLVAELERRREPIQRAIDVTTIASSVVLIVLALTLSGAAVTWIAFALALGYVVQGFAGLSLHEVATWRDAHHMEQLYWTTRRSGPDRRPERVDPASAADHRLAA